MRAGASEMEYNRIQQYTRFRCFYVVEQLTFLIHYEIWLHICKRANLKQTSGSSAGTNCDKKPQHHKVLKVAC